MKDLDPQRRGQFVLQLSQEANELEMGEERPPGKGYEEGGQHNLGYQVTIGGTILRPMSCVCYWHKDENERVGI